MSTMALLTEHRILLLILACVYAITGYTAVEEADWWQDGQEELQDSITQGFQLGVAKNVILFIGDGMGPATVSAARVYNSQSRNIPYKDAWLGWERFPNTALARTYTTNMHVPDSAGTATAFLCGEKTITGVLGMAQQVIRGDCSSTTGLELKSILKYAQDEGKWTGVVTTTRVTHATPAVAYATSCDRNWEADQDIPEGERDQGCTDIAAQLIDTEYGKNIRVVLGGGRRSFYPANQTDPEGADRDVGRRLDNRDLTQEWYNDKLNRGYDGNNVHYVMNQTQFDNVDSRSAQFLMGLFEASHMQYETDRLDPLVETWGEPSLEEMVEKAIKILRRNPEGFFLMVEGGRIDHAHHDNYVLRALTDTLAMSDAVQRANEMTSVEDTLIVVSADHSHSFTFSGYGTIEQDILGLVDTQHSANGLPYTSLSYANGPGWVYHRNTNSSVQRNLTQDAEEGLLGTRDYRYDAGVWLDSETHSGVDVAVYARGPMSHLFKGTRQQHFIAHAMMYASCVGPNQELCDSGPEYPGCPNCALHKSINPIVFLCILVVYSVFFQ